MLWMVCVSLWILFVIWFVSFCVGYSIKVCIWKCFMFSCFNSFRLNVVVLFELVLFWVIIFWLFKIGGRFCVWIVVMVVYLSEVRFFNNLGFNFNDEKVFWFKRVVFLVLLLWEYVVLDVVIIEGRIKRCVLIYNDKL